MARLGGGGWDGGTLRPRLRPGPGRNLGQSQGLGHTRPTSRKTQAKSPSFGGSFRETTLRPAWSNQGGFSKTTRKPPLSSAPQPSRPSPAGRLAWCFHGQGTAPNLPARRRILAPSVFCNEAPDAQDQGARHRKRPLILSLNHSRHGTRRKVARQPSPRSALRHRPWASRNRKSARIRGQDDPTPRHPTRHHRPRAEGLGPLPKLAGLRPPACAAGLSTTPQGSPHSSRMNAPTVQASLRLPRPFAGFPSGLMALPAGRDEPHRFPTPRTLTSQAPFPRRSALPGSRSVLSGALSRALRETLSKPLAPHLGRRAPRREP